LRKMNKGGRKERGYPEGGGMDGPRGEKKGGGLKSEGNN